MSSSSIISSPYMVDRKGVRRTFRRTFFHGIEIYLLSEPMLWPIGCLGHASFREASRRLPLWQFIPLCSASCACITVSTFLFRGLSSGYPFLVLLFIPHF